LSGARASEAETIADQIRFCEVPAPPFAEAARGAVLQRAFQELGLRNVAVDAAGNVLGERPGAAARPHLVIAAHLDTVFPEGTDVRVRREGSILHGPGIGDNCRGLAVLVAIARELRNANVRTNGTITFVANVGEEGLGDLRGVKALFGGTLKGRIDRFVSIDNGGLHVTHRAVGSRRYRVTFKGPGGHSYGAFGTPSPIGALARAAASISDFQVGLEPRTTFNVGRIGGGTSVNSIPTEAWMEVDLRSSDAASLGALDRKFHAAVDGAAAAENARWGRSGVIAVQKVLVGDRPAGETPVASSIVTTARSVASALGLAAPLAEGSTDANLPMSLNIPAITIGAGGRAADTHAPTESFDTTDSWKGTQFGLLLAVALTRE
jgi:acetylornithine deacetylase/succinyl-diaminopimelate desuccinylase-like protein